MTFNYWGATIKRVDTSKGLRYRVWLPGREEYSEWNCLPEATHFVYAACVLGE